jgi:hypothetical protein
MFVLFAWRGAHFSRILMRIDLAARRECKSSQRARLPRPTTTAKKVFRKISMQRNLICSRRSMPLRGKRSERPQHAFFILLQRNGVRFFHFGFICENVQ